MSEQERKIPIDDEGDSKNKKTSIGLDENIGGMLCYIFIIGLIFLFMEKENRFIRFHALQAVFLGVALLIINLVLGIIPIIGVIISFLMAPFVLFIVIFMMYQTYQGKLYKLPFIGDMAEKQLK